MVSTALFTAQNTYALLVGLVEGFPCADMIVEPMYCEETSRPVENVVLTTKGLVERNTQVLDGTTVKNKYNKLILR